MPTDAIAEFRAEWDEAHELLVGLGLEQLVRRSERLLAESGTDQFYLVVCGEFKRGKSTLINSLLGDEELLPTDVVPTTANLHMISYGPEKRYRPVPREGEPGEWQKISPRELQRFSAEPSGGEGPDEELAYLEIEHPHPLLKDGLTIIDTPGVNDLSETRAEITYGFIPRADAALVLFDATQPVTGSERKFLEETLLQHPRPRLLFLLNKFDLLNDEEQEDALEAARERVEKVTGRDSELLPSVANDPESEEFRAMAERIDGLVNSPARRKYKLRRHVRNGLSILADAESKLEQKLEMLDSSVEELEEKKRELEQGKEEFHDRMEKLADYIEREGQERLLDMLRESIAVHRQETVEDLSARVGSVGKVSRYAENKLGHDLKMAQRRWLERKLPEIQNYLKRFTQAALWEYQTKVLDEMERDVSAPDLELGAGRGRRLGSGSGSTSDLLQVSDEEDLLSRYGMPALGGVIAGLVFTGGMAIVGVGAGLLASQVQQRERHEQAKAELRGKLPELVDQQLSGLEENLTEQIREWFSQFARSIVQDAKQRRREYEEQIDEALERLRGNREERERWQQKQEDALVKFNKTERELRRLLQETEKGD